MIYFDNAATGFPKSRNVKKAMLHAFDNCGNPGRSMHKYSVYSSDIIYSAREKLSSIFDTTAEKTVLCPSATYALNIAIKGLKKSDMPVIISDMEHNSVIRPAFSVDEAKIFQTNIDDDTITIENFLKTLNSTNPSVVAITHASNVCGRILPIEEIAKICSSKGIPIILDASQTAGYIKVDFKTYPVDVICIPGHKGFLGPMGTGAMLINPSKEYHFKTIIEGGTGISSYDKNMPDILPERLEAGTLSVHNFAGFTAALNECDFAFDELHKKYVYLINELNKIKSIKLYGVSFDNLNKYMPIILLNHTNISTTKFCEMLEHKGFCVRCGFHCSPLAHRKLNTGKNGAIRVSLGKNNKFFECEKFIKTIKALDI